MNYKFFFFGLIFVLFTAPSSLCLHYLDTNTIIPDEQKTLFSALPNQPFIQGILEQIHPYQFLMEEEGTSPFLLIKSLSTYAYLAGIPCQKALQEIATQLKACSGVSLICDERLHGFFIQEGFRLQPRIDLEYDPASQPAQREVPAGYTIRPINTLDLFKQCLWFDFISLLYGDAEQFLNRGFGYALVDEMGKPVAQSYAGCIGNGLCEVGVITDPAHQSKGYSTLVTEYLIAECLRRNLKPCWTCDTQNMASLKVALKSGFKIKGYYAFLKV
jgi:RimJ/RimL family protein N-acetyltransferase